MPQKRASKHRSRQPAASRASSGADSAVQAKKFYGLLNRLLEGIFEDRRAEKNLEYSVQSFLRKVLKASGGAAAAIYQVEDKSVKLAGSCSYPRRLRDLLAEQGISESHLKGVIRKKAPLFILPGNRKIFSIKGGNSKSFGKFAVTEIPVVDRTRVVGVVELIGGDLNEHGDAVVKKIGEYTRYLLLLPQAVYQHGMSAADTNRPSKQWPMALRSSGI